MITASVRISVSVTHVLFRPYDRAWYCTIDVKHGCLSPRRFYNALSAVYNKFNEQNISKPPVSLHGQLMWREYNYLMCYTTPNCHQTIGNPIARRTYM